MKRVANMPLGASSDPDAPFNRPDDDFIRTCPECNADIDCRAIILPDEITSCLDHMTDIELRGEYRDLKKDHENLKQLLLNVTRGTGEEFLLAKLEDANRSRAKLGNRIYLLTKMADSRELRIKELDSQVAYRDGKIDEFQGIIKRKDLHIEALELALKDAIKVGQGLSERASNQ